MKNPIIISGPTQRMGIIVVSPTNEIIARITKNSIPTKNISNTGVDFIIYNYV